MPAGETAVSNDVVICRGKRFRPYLSRDTIQQRVRELGAEISRDYEGKTPILIGVLNGAFIFLADLMRAMDIECEVDFLKLSSYGSRMVSTGQVQELKKIDANLEGRDVLVVEDIVDTGHSMQFILQRLQEYNPASLRAATLLYKPDAVEVELPLDYVGFEIDNLFVIGYGLDYGQIARNLADIYILDEEEGEE